MMRRRIAAATPYLTSRRSGACWSHAMMRTSAVAHAPSPTHAPLVRAPFVLHPLAEPRRLAHTHNPTAAPEGLLGDEEEKTLLRSAIEEIIAFQSEVAKKPVEVAAARARDKKATSLALRFLTNADALELMAEALNPHEIVRDLRFLSHFFFYRDAIVASFFTQEDSDSSASTFLLLSDSSFRKTGQIVVEHRGWFAVRVMSGEIFGEGARAFAASVARLCLRDTLKARLLACRENEEVFPSFFGQTSDAAFRDSFRPLPTTRLAPLLYSLGAHRIPAKNGGAPAETLESFTRYPFIINGPSGSGKSVAALQLAEMMCGKREKQRGLLVAEATKAKKSVCPKALSAFDPRHVIGCYIKVAKDKWPDVDADANTDDGSITACDRAHELVAKVAQTVSDICRHQMGIPVPPEGFDLSGVHLHIVLDEMGAYPNLVRIIVRDHRAFCDMVRDALRTSEVDGRPLIRFGTDSNVNGVGLLTGLTVTTAVVGTGVDSAGIKNGSIGQPLWRVFVATSPYSFLERMGLAAGVSKVPVLHALVGNFRCAAILAKLALSPDTYAHQCHDDMRPVAGKLLEDIVDGYLNANSWREVVDNAAAALHSAQIITLLFTQHFETFPCHMIDDTDIAFLSRNLGAIDDRLCWVEQEPTGVKRLPSIANESLPEGFCGLYGVAPHSGLYSTIRPRSTASTIQPLTTGSAATQVGDGDACAPHHANLRFDVPPSIAIIAITRFANHLGLHPFAGDHQSPAATYESLAAAAFSAMLYVAERQGADMPLSMLLSSFGRGGDGKQKGFGAKVHDALLSSSGGGRNFDAKPAIVVAPFLHAADPNATESIAKLVNRSHCVVEKAAPNTAQNDATIHAKGYSIGFEFKYYADGGAVDVCALVRRAMQMGYAHVEVTVPYVSRGAEDGWGNFRFFVDSPVYDLIKNIPPCYHHCRPSNKGTGGEVTFFVSTLDTVGNSINSCAAVRSAVVRAARMRAEGNADIIDRLILCGPDAAHPLIPKGCSVTFRKRMDLSSDDKKGAWSSAVKREGQGDASQHFASLLRKLPTTHVAMFYDTTKSVSVSCWAFSMELLVCSTCDGLLPSPHPSPRCDFTKHAYPSGNPDRPGFKFVDHVRSQYVTVNSEFSVNGYSHFEKVAEQQQRDKWESARSRRI